MMNRRRQPGMGGTRRGGWSWRAFTVGVLTANSVPHLATAARGQHMLTPLGGQDSGPGRNLVWGSINLAAGAFSATAALRGTSTAKESIVPFAAGAAVFAAWVAVYEKCLAGESPQA